MKNVVTVSVAALLLAVVCSLLWLGHVSQETTARQAIQAAAVEKQNDELTPRYAATKRPANSVDTPGNGFVVEASGHLKITQNLRHIFDYFLGAQGGAPSDANIARAQRYILEQLQEPAATEASLILKDYVTYRKAVVELQSGSSAASPPGEDLASIAKIQQLTTLKAKYLSPEVIQAFYDDEDAIARYMLARKQIVQMNGLNKEQREGQLAALLQQLPASARRALEDSVAIPEN